MRSFITRLVPMLGLACVIAYAVRERPDSHDARPSVLSAPAPTARSTTFDAPRPALAAAPSPSLEAMRRAAGDYAALAVLPPEDADWVLGEVARTQQVRALGETERSELIAQLASIRMFTVLEREEPLALPEERAP